MSALKICPQCGTEYELDQRFCPKDGSTLKSQGSAAGDLIGAIIADRYNVIKKLGEGGMGTVYLAEHIKMGRKSAVKVMNPGMVNDADAISRFNREAANASRINHPNVAAVYDFGETSDGLIYLAMEYIEGPSLTKVIEQSGSLPPIRAADITRQAAEALAVAHDMGIVHRDLKPDNIMLTKNRDGSDCVKVVDFGIAKAANSEAQKVTKTGLVVGTPEYMSPEQLAGDKLDGRSDTYSLGLVAFAMMTGKLPFPADTIQESMIARLTDRPKQLIEMKTDVAWPPEVQAVMDKALERDTGARYQTSSEFGRDLYKTVSAMPESAATAAFTSVMGRVSTPRAPAVGAPVKPGSTKPIGAIPATKVNPATPAQAAPAVSAPKSKVPMLAVIGVVVVVGAVGGYLLTLGKGTDAAGATTPPVGQQTGAPLPATVDFAKEMVVVDSLSETTSTPENARLALAKLDSIGSFAKTKADSVHVAFARAESHFLLNESKTGCDILKNNEGKAAGTPFEKRVKFYLYGDRAQNLPAPC